MSEDFYLNNFCRLYNFITCNSWVTNDTSYIFIIFKSMCLDSKYGLFHTHDAFLDCYSHIDIYSYSNFALSYVFYHLIYIYIHITYVLLMFLIHLFILSKLQCLNLHSCFGSSRVLKLPVNSSKLTKNE